MKCPDCGGREFEIFRVGGGIFHCQCKNCSNEFEAKAVVYGEPLKIIGPWRFKKRKAK